MSGVEEEGNKAKAGRVLVLFLSALVCSSEEVRGAQRRFSLSRCGPVGHWEPNNTARDRLYYYRPGTRFGASWLFDHAKGVAFEFCTFLR